MTLAKHFLLTITLCHILVQVSFCQHSDPLVCGPEWPPKTNRPDTITVYSFTDRIVPVSGFTGCHATSNYSLKAKHFNAVWIPVNTRDIDAFIARSFKAADSAMITGTTKCTIFGNEHLVVMLKTKKKLRLLIYQNKNGKQSIFSFLINRKKYLPEAMNFIETKFIK